MNRLLQRQLKRAFGKNVDPETLPEEVKKLLKNIDASYEAFEKEKRFLEHILQVNSDELNEAYNLIEKHNRTLKEEVAAKTNILEQYKEAIDQALLVSKTDPAGYITYANDLFCKISGYSREELIGKPHNIVRHPDTDPAVFKEMWKTILAKKIWHGELKNRRKDGSAYYVNATILPLINRHGEIEEFIAMRQDITDRVIAEINLDRQRRYSQMLFEHQENIVITASETEGVISANHNFFETFGFKDIEDFKSKHNCICNLFEEEEGYLPPSKDSIYWARNVLENPNKQHKVLMRNAAGERRIFNVALKEIVFDNEHFIIASFTDITELEAARRRAEASEKAKAIFMANMSHEIRTPMNGIVGFTQLLQQSDLTIRQKRFVTLIEQSTKTLLGIVNDILDFSKIESGKLELDYVRTNPFVDLRNAIAIFSDKAREKDISLQITIDPHISECLMMDHLRVTQILTNLISNAIKFTPEHGIVAVDLIACGSTKKKECIHFSVTDSGIGIPPERLEKIFEPFTQADASTTRNFGGTGLGLSIAASLCSLMGGELKVESTPGKGSRFYFSVEFEKCESNQILSEQIHHKPVYVVQSGSDRFISVLQQLNHFGISYQIIPPEMLEQMEENHITFIFEAAHYEKVRHKTSHIILIDNSDAAAKISENDTTVFHIYAYEECPSIIYNAMLALNAIPESKKNPIKKSSDIHLKVLVAEDYDINRILIKEMLSEYGITPDFALDGAEAVEMALRKKYDLILMDINMPKLNGMDATIQLREHEITTPIVALTANALEGDAERFLALGMDDYISKPIDWNELDAVLRRYAGKSSKNMENRTAEEKGDDRSMDSNHVVENAVTSLLQAKSKLHFALPVIVQLFMKFVDTSMESLELMLKGIADNDLKTVQERAHAIRGIALSLQFNEIGALCETLEYSAKQGKEIDYNDVAGQLSEKLTALQKHTDDIIAQLQATEA